MISITMASRQIGKQLFCLLQSPVVGITAVLVGSTSVLYGFAFGYINDVEDFIRPLRDILIRQCSFEQPESTGRICLAWECELFGISLI